MLGAEDVSRLTDEIYDAAVDVGHWPRVLERLAQCFGSSSAHIAVDNYAMTQGRLVSFGTDPAYARRYADHYITRNVLWQRMVKRSLYATMTNRTVMPVEELRRSEFYNDFLRPQDGEEILVTVASQQPDRATMVMLWRPARFGAWEPEQMEDLALLTPHLRRALRVNQGIGDLRLAHDAASEVLYRLEHGVILVDAGARVLFANRAAEAMLRDAGPLRLEGHRLAARRAADLAAVRRLIAAAAQRGTGGSLVMTREERPCLALHVMPVRAGSFEPFRDHPSAILLIKDLERPPKPFLAVFARHFGLTPAQAALAHELVRGDGAAAAASRLGISYATARTHLLQIFQKTDVRRQAELVRLMLEWSDESAIMGNGDADAGSP